MANYFTTDNKQSNNSIALASKMLPILDEVYKASSRTAILDTANDRVNWVGAKIVNLFKTSMDGLGNYNRNKGFVTGDITSTWEPLEITQDRARSFLVDTMDNDESLGMALGTTMGEFLRTQVVPELDAYRLAKYASWTGVQAGTPVDLTSAADLPGLIAEGEYQLSDKEVPEEGRILFISEAGYKFLKEDVVRIVENDATGINHAIEYFDNMRVVRVPQSRFNTAITLRDGITASQEAGGFVPTAGGYKINFMIVHPSAVIQIVKHVIPRMFAPDVNQSADGWLVQYRCYHDAFVEANKVNGIYVNRASTANT